MPDRLKIVVRDAARGARLARRRVDAGQRALPDFLVLGAQRTGTTSLYAYLSAHPRVRPAARKEVHYFDLNYRRGVTWYRSMFPRRRELAALARRGDGPAITGEASPYYLFHPLAAERAAQLLPDARLIAILRDPVERAWSHYRHELAAGRERLSFPDAIAAEDSRLAGAEDDLRAGRSSPAVVAHRRASYLGRGRYAEQLRRWLAHYPRAALLVIRAEELFARPDEVYDRVLRFLELPPDRPATFSLRNAAPQARLAPQTADDVRARLATANADLVELLGPQWVWPAGHA